MWIIIHAHAHTHFYTKTVFMCVMEALPNFYLPSSSVIDIIFSCDCVCTYCTVLSYSHWGVIMCPQWGDFPNLTPACVQDEDPVSELAGWLVIKHIFRFSWTRGLSFRLNLVHTAGKDDRGITGRRNKCLGVIQDICLLTLTCFITETTIITVFVPGCSLN